MYIYTHIYIYIYIYICIYLYFSVYNLMQKQPLFMFIFELLKLYYFFLDFFQFNFLGKHILNYLPTYLCNLNTVHHSNCRALVSR